MKSRRSGTPLQAVWRNEVWRVIVTGASIGIVAALMSFSLLRQHEIEPAAFWDLYFSGRIVALRHVGGAVSGKALAEQPVSGPASFLRDRVETSFRISDQALRLYPYESDARFVMASSAGVAEAFDAVIDQTYRYRDAAPFGKARMAELFTEVSRRLPGGRASTQSVLERAASEMIAAQSEAFHQPVAALIWFLGERRERSGAGTAIAILRNVAQAGPGKFRFHYTAVDAAYSAIWKINDKSQLPELLDLMRQSDDTGRRKYAMLFERLLSTDELLGFERFGSAWSRPEFWAKFVTPARTASDWDRYDSQSLFWENRYLAASRLAPSEPSLRALADDIVGTVRLQALSRRSAVR